jgi:hypothetical protein
MKERSELPRSVQDRDRIVAAEAVGLVNCRHVGLEWIILISSQHNTEWMIVMDMPV